MTGALQTLADEKLRTLLAQTVNSPLKGAITGSLATAVLQSSSATTVAAVGFVGAGLLTFSESLGVIFGANIGTTITGWLVALLGFKLQLGQVLLPLILVGVLLRLTGSRRLEQVGMTIAGFGLVFVGIDLLQQGLSGLQGQVAPIRFPPDTVIGRILLVVIGLLITIITQSSSAGVAMALTAVHTGTITLNQAAAMVIGMDLGTTATAALATVGGSVHARRTGFAHVIYNSMTAIGAFLLLTPYMIAVEALLPGVRLREPELVLVGFHTFFNALGVIAVLPFTTRFANLVIRLIPEKGNPLTMQLDRSLLVEPGVAIEATQGTLRTISTALLTELGHRLGAGDRSEETPLFHDSADALDRTNDFLQAISVRLRTTLRIDEYVSCIHVLDHLRRIDSRVREGKRLQKSRDDARLASMSAQLQQMTEKMIGAPESPTITDAKEIRAINRKLKTAMRAYRSSILRDSSAGVLTTSEAIARMDTARSLRRIGYHIWRIAHHLTKSTTDSQ